MDLVHPPPCLLALWDMMSHSFLVLPYLFQSSVSSEVSRRAKPSVPTDTAGTLFAVIKGSQRLCPVFPQDTCSRHHLRPCVCLCVMTIKSFPFATEHRRLMLVVQFDCLRQHCPYLFLLTLLFPILSLPHPPLTPSPVGRGEHTTGKKRDSVLRKRKRSPPCREPMRIGLLWNEASEEERILPGYV